MKLLKKLAFFSCSKQTFTSNQTVGLVHNSFSKWSILSPSSRLFVPTSCVQHPIEAETRTGNCDQRAKASSCTTARCRTAHRRVRRPAGTLTPNQRRWAAKSDSWRTEQTIAPAPTSPVRLSLTENFVKFRLKELKEFIQSFCFCICFTS